MNSILYTVLLSVLWIANMFKGTELDNNLHITDYLKYSIITVFLIIFVVNNIKKNNDSKNSSDVKYYLLMFFWMILDSIFHGAGVSALDYLWVFCLVYVLGKIELDERTAYIVGWIYGIAGILVIYVYNNGSVFSGWNENSVAMLSFHSILIFMIPFYERWKIHNKIALIIVMIMFAILIIPTESRSCIWFAGLAFLFAFRLLQPRILFSNPKRVYVWLLVPLFVVVFVSLISDASFFQSLDKWSVEQFNKPFFNGRNKIWKYGFGVFWDQPIWGAGIIDSGLHNSAITALASFGIVGYYFWIRSLYSILHTGLDYLNDNITSGIMISFIILYFQQSVEVGLFSSSPSILPYILLGMLLGRVKYLAKNDLIVE